MPRRRPSPALVALSLAALVTATACDAEVTDADPAGAVQLFIEAMARSQTQQAAIRDAFHLLDGPARRELGRRAERASTLSGRRFHPWDMIPQGRFRLRFRPRREDAYRARVRGDHATVTVWGASEGQSAEVPLVREDGRWRIALPLPGARRRAPGDGEGPQVSSPDPAG